MLCASPRPSWKSAPISMKICPDATVFNFSNPMSRICTTVTRAFPDLKFIGLCHEINSLEHLPAPNSGDALRKPQSPGCRFEPLQRVLTAEYAETGEDAYPDIRAKAPHFFGNMPSLEPFINISKRPVSGLKNPKIWLPGNRSLA